MSYIVYVNLFGVNCYGSGLNNLVDGILIVIFGIGGYLINFWLNVFFDFNWKYLVIFSVNCGFKFNLEDGGIFFGIFFFENWIDFIYIGICEGFEYKVLFVV